MWLLYDAVLPQSLSDEAPPAMLRRWSGADDSDEDLVRFVSGKGGRGLILLGRDSLEQPDLRNLARELGVALVAVATDDPIEAKLRVLNNLNALRRSLETEDCLLVLASGVRPVP